MTVAMAIVLVVTGAVFALMDPVHGPFRAEPEVIDAQQRLRVVVDAITRDLIMAGAGSGKYFASVLPLRRGPLLPDPPGTFFDDRISVLYTPAGAPATRVSVATDGGNVVYVTQRPQCPLGDPLCGFEVNALVAIFDDTGTYDTFRVAAVQEQPPALLRASGVLSKSYAANARVVGVVSATYWLRNDAVTGTSELMRYDGRQTDLPIADDVADLTFEYYGDPMPPVLRRLLSEVAGPWTSYGPKPPEVGLDDPATPAYGSGENCVFTVLDGVTIGRAEMGVLGVSSSLVRLQPNRLTDGPWCPDPLAPNRFDADLLRVRRVRVKFAVRGRPVIFDVAPRNLSLPQ